jgi:pSer/pThr/pTyr-binding forkhead associated (FHA) protein
MDDAKLATAGSELPLQGPHYSRPLPCPEQPPAFFPLKLMIKPGGSILELTRPDMLMGRHSQSDIRLPLPDVSRRHCRLLFTEGAWHVFDLDSLNGVFVNGEPVRHAVLHDHDVLAIGGFQFEVDLSDGSSAPASSENAAAVIHRFPESLPHATLDLDSQRRAS